MNVFRFITPDDHPQPSEELIKRVEAQFTDAIAAIAEQPQLEPLTFDEMSALFAFLLQRAMRSAER